MSGSFFVREQHHLENIWEIIKPTHPSYLSLIILGLISEYYRAGSHLTTIELKLITSDIRSRAMRDRSTSSSGRKSHVGECRCLLF